MEPPPPRSPIRARRRRPAALAALASVVLLAGGCSPRGGPADVAEVVLLGDSIAEEAMPYLRAGLDSAVLYERVFGGTAPCDWEGQDLRATPRRLVVVSFTGNSLTPCMADGAGGQLHGEALVAKYRRDLTALVEQLRTAGARVLLVGQPRRGPSAGPVADLEVAGINEVYAELAGHDGVSFVDAGAAVEHPDGTFAQALPCLPGEAECGASGRNAVRNEDGVHLCEVIAPVACPGYSSGAYRFATAIAVAIHQMAG